MATTTVTAANAAQLLTAFNSATTNMIIKLMPGNYGDVSLKNSTQSGTITIISSTSTNQAVFHSLNLTNEHNINIQNVQLSHALGAADSINSSALIVNKSNDIYLSGLYVHGSLNNSSFDDGNGITVTDSKRIGILDSRFDQLNNAFSVSRVDGFAISGNTVTGVRQGFMGLDVHHGLLELNYMHHFQPNYAAGDHPDQFQLGTGLTGNASSDITFQNNVLVQPADTPTGGIFIKSELADQGIHHTNISIINNYVLGDYRHGISLTGVDNAVIRGNSVVNSIDGVGITPVIYMNDAHNVVIDRNIEPNVMVDVLHPSSGLVITNDVRTWDVRFPGGVPVSSVLDVPMPDAVTISKLGALAGSIAATLGAGFVPVAQIGNLTTSNAESTTLYKAKIAAMMTASTVGATSATTLSASGVSDSGLGSAATTTDSSATSLPGTSVGSTSVSSVTTVTGVFGDPTALFVDTSPIVLPSAFGSDSINVVSGFISAGALPGSMVTTTAQTVFG